MGAGELGNWSFRTTSRNIIVGGDSVVSIATLYGLYGPENESRECEIFRTRPDQPWGPPNLLYAYNG